MFKKIFGQGSGGGGGGDKAGTINAKSKPIVGGEAGTNKTIDAIQRLGEVLVRCRSNACGA